jgi:hypothetical protein
MTSVTPRLNGRFEIVLPRTRRNHEVQARYSQSLRALERQKWTRSLWEALW